MTLRHRILKWLAMGDLVLLNAEVFADGTLRRKEAGEIFLSNISAGGSSYPYAIYSNQRAFRVGALRLDCASHMLLDAAWVDGTQYYPEVPR